MRNTWKKTTYMIISTIALVCLTCTQVHAERAGWQRKEVNWQAGPGRRIKAIHYPQDQKLPTKARVHQHRRRAGAQKSSDIAAQLYSTASTTAKPQALPSVVNYDIDVESPPVDGFTPWIAISATNENAGDMDYTAVPEPSVAGRYPSGIDPDRDFMIGIYDTGASAHVIGYNDARLAGLFSGGLVTGNGTDISGVTGTVTASISFPLAVFVSGLHAVDPQALTLDRSYLKGQSNVSVMVGRNPGSNADLPSAIGSPMSVYYTAVIYNDQPITLERNGEVFTAPDIRIYEHDGAAIPTFANRIPLELRPLGAVNVQYIDYPDILGLGDALGGLGDLEDILGGIGGGGTSTPEPDSPSIIVGNASQSLFFVHSVDLYSNGQSAIDKDRFMLDTGAQVTVIGYRMAARLKLDINNPAFDVEIEDVTGQVALYPGFYLDAIEIPALGQWLRFTNVPVTLLDVASPEGGTLDGIIGMNLFKQFNLVLRGGGLAYDEEPYLAFEPIAANDAGTENSSTGAAQSIPNQ